MNIPNVRKIENPTEKCDVCRTALGHYYSLTWYIHFCTKRCFEEFLTNYYKEIDSIAIERKRAEELKDEV